MRNLNDKTAFAEKILRENYIEFRGAETPKQYTEAIFKKDMESNLARGIDIIKQLCDQTQQADFVLIAIEKMKAYIDSGKCTVSTVQSCFESIAKMIKSVPTDGMTGERVLHASIELILLALPLVCVDTMVFAIASEFKLDEHTTQLLNMCISNIPSDVIHIKKAVKEESKYDFIEYGITKKLMKSIADFRLSQLYSREYALAKPTEVDENINLIREYRQDIVSRLAAFCLLSTYADALLRGIKISEHWASGKAGVNIFAHSGYHPSREDDECYEC